MQLESRALGSEPMMDSSRYFRLGHRHYLARPTGFKRHHLDIDGVKQNDRASLATYFRVQTNQIINVDFLRAWRANYLDADDAFHSSFLGEVIFGGADNVQLRSDTADVFEAWSTRQVSFAPNVIISNGPYYVKEDFLYSVWRVYEDRQLNFVQAIWPSIEDER